jgi:dihydroneopterin aldolase
MSQNNHSILNSTIAEEGIIGFDNLCIPCVVGVHPHERDSEQYVHIDLRVSADISRCATTDHVSDAIDYEKLANICIELAQTKKYKLLERMAWEILDEVLDQFPVSWASIVIKKEKALNHADRSVVELKKRKF